MSTHTCIMEILLDFVHMVLCNNILRGSFIFFSLNDLVLVSPNQFYATKTHRLRRGWRLLETLLLINWGELLFYDGNTVRTVDAGLSFPNGINVSPSQRSMSHYTPFQL